MTRLAALVSMTSLESQESIMNKTMEGLKQQKEDAELEAENVKPSGVEVEMMELESNPLLKGNNAG